MTGLEAWQILSADLNELFRLRMTIDSNLNMTTPYFKEEMTAQVMAFEALRRMDGDGK